MKMKVKIILIIIILSLFLMGCESEFSDCTSECWKIEGCGISLHNNPVGEDCNSSEVRKKCFEVCK